MTDRGPTLAEVVPLFKQYDEARDLSAATVRWRKKMLHRAIERMGHKPMLDITIVHLREYAIWLRAQNIKHETRRAHIRVLRELFKWFYSDPVFDGITQGRRNPAAYLDIPRRERRIVRPFDLADLRKLFDTAGPGREGRRNRAMIMCFLEGLRLSELCGMRMEHLDMDNRILRVFGKGRKERLVVLSRNTMRYLRIWLAVRPQTTTAVFCSLRGRDLGAPLTDNGVATILWRWKKRSGIRTMNAHSFRHAFGSEYVARGGDPRSLADLMGHADPKFTMSTYVHFNTVRLRNAHERYSATANISVEDKSNE